MKTFALKYIIDYCKNLPNDSVKEYNKKYPIRIFLTEAEKELQEIESFPQIIDLLDNEIKKYREAQNAKHIKEYGHLYTRYENKIEALSGFRKILDKKIENYN